MTNPLLTRQWPKLADFPSTNGLMVVAILMWLATCGAALVLAFLGGKEIPSSWYNTLNVYTGTVVVQFGLKRFSDSSYVESKTAGKALAAGLLSGAPRSSTSTSMPSSTGTP